MSIQSGERDERTISVENASYRLSHMVLSFGLLVATAYRVFAKNDSAWDLLALVMIGGFVANGYQGAHRVLTRRWLVLNLVVMLTAAIVLSLRAAPPATGPSAEPPASAPPSSPATA